LTLAEVFLFQDKEFGIDIAYRHVEPSFTYKRNIQMRILVLTLMMSFLSHSAFGAAEGKRKVLRKPCRKSEGWLSHKQHQEQDKLESQALKKCRTCHWEVFRGDKHVKMNYPQKRLSHFELIGDFRWLYVSKTGEHAPENATCDDFKNWYLLWEEYYGGVQVPDYTIRDQNIYLRPDASGRLVIVFDWRK
jgi:hypothetical protein